MPTLPMELLAEVIENLTPTLTRTARRLVPWCAEDGVGEARYEMVAAAPKFDPGHRAGMPPKEALSAYMFRVGQQAILRVAARGTGRQRDRRYTWGACIDWTVPPDVLGRVPVEDDLTGPIAQAMLDAVPAHAQGAVALVVRGYTRTEAARALGVSKQTLRKRLRSAQASIRRAVPTG